MAGLDQRLDVHRHDLLRFGGGAAKAKNLSGFARQIVSGQRKGKLDDLHQGGLNFQRAHQFQLALACGQRRAIAHRQCQGIGELSGQVHEVVFGSPLMGRDFVLQGLGDAGGDA